MVVLIIGRSIELVVAELACLRLGAAYVPIDPRQPPLRIQAISNATSSTVEITLGPERDFVIEESPNAATDAKQGQPVPPAAMPAYVIFTSGSTGAPKGVIVSHSAIARLVRDQDLVAIGPTDTVAFASNPSFDASTWEVWGALANGATLVVLDDDTITSAHRLASAIARERITAMFLTTSLFNFIAYEEPSAFRGLRYLIFGGEACDIDAVRRVVERGGVRHLINGYGPTESTTFALWWEVRESDIVGGSLRRSSLPIGLPLNGTTIAVVGADDRPVATGDPGELLLGGSGLALGYLADEALTSERFVYRDGERWYRTGDLVRRRRGGAVDYLGRVDRQVKVRGFRIQPEEIEAVLSSYPSVRRAAVLVHRGAISNELHGVVEATGVNPSELRGFLGERLPGVMVPSQISVLERFPINKNGKVDRSALAELVDHRPPTDAPHAALDVDDPIEEIWSRVLGVSDPDPDARFVDLGGHSMLAARIVAEVRSATGIDLPLSILVEHPTLRLLKEAITEHALVGPRSKTLVTLRKGGDRSLWLVHPAGGLLYCFDSMLPRLETARSIRGFIAAGIETGGPWDPSFEAMAAHYFDEMKNFGLDDAPLVLGGFSSGAWVSVEIARLAQAEGIAVGGLVMLDPPVLATSDDRSGARRRLDRLHAGISPQGFFYQVDTLRKRARAKRIEEADASASMSVDVSSALNIDHTIDMLNCYAPVRLEHAVPTLLVQARRAKGPLSRSMVNESCVALVDPDATIIEVQAEHNGPRGMFVDPAVETVSVAVNAFLERLDAPA